MRFCCVFCKCISCNQEPPLTPTGACLLSPIVMFLIIILSGIPLWWWHLTELFLRSILICRTEEEELCRNNFKSAFPRGSLIREVSFSTPTFENCDQVVTSNTKTNISPLVWFIFTKSFSFSCLSISDNLELYHDPLHLPVWTRPWDSVHARAGSVLELKYDGILGVALGSNH